MPTIHESTETTEDDGEDDDNMQLSNIDILEDEEPFNYRDMDNDATYQSSLIPGSTNQLSALDLAPNLHATQVLEHKIFFAFPAKHHKTARVADLSGFLTESNNSFLGGSAVINLLYQHVRMSQIFFDRSTSNS